MGIWDFEVFWIKVKDKWDCVKRSIFDDGIKFKIVNELFIIWKVDLKVKEVVLFEEIKEREKYLFLDSYFERVYKLLVFIKFFKKLYDDIFVKKIFKVKILVIE